jgi:hypothetical protein
VIPIKSGKLDRPRTTTYEKRLKRALVALEIPYRWKGIPGDQGYADEGRRLVFRLLQEKGTSNG